MTSSLWLDGFGIEVRYRTAGRIRTRCLETGSGPPLLVLHGVEASAENHLRNMAALGSVRSVIALDLLGHGLTDKPDCPYEIDDYVGHVLALMDSLELERVDVLGQSLGGWIACRLALDEPERVGRLVLNTMAGLPIPDDEGRRAFEDLVERSGQAMRSLDPAVIRRRLEWIVADPSTITDEVVELRRRIWSQPDWQRIAATVVGVLTPARYEPQQIGPDELEEIEAPTLLVWTAANPVHGLDAASQAVAALPQGELVVIDSAAHWPQFERPEAFDSAVVSFLSEAGGFPDLAPSGALDSAEGG
jgi:2-hydroxy-6-oxo-6-(2'-carboxyphenyl)-hexa-2,4-dienoate hydrolase